MFLAFFWGARGSLDGFDLINIHIPHAREVGFIHPYVLAL
jgi:hypothetical protein